MFNRTKYHNATRRGQNKPKSDFIDVWKFKLAVPPMLADKSETERANFIRDLITIAEEKFRKAREYKPPLGTKTIFTQQPLDRQTAKSLFQAENQDLLF